MFNRHPSGLRPCVHLSTTTVAQVSNLLYRRFPIGRRSKTPGLLDFRSVCRLEALRYSRLETCATVVVSKCTTRFFRLFVFALILRGLAAEFGSMAQPVPAAAASHAGTNSSIKFRVAT